jgi:hypothetical protein
MGGDDDLVDAAPAQAIDLPVDDRGELALDRDVAGRGDRRDVRRREADDADALLAAPDDDRRRDAAVVG